jgi:hypothetical protein
MIKHWKAVHRSVGMRSYHLEVIALNIFERHAIDDYRLALWTFFDEAPNCCPVGMERSRR